MINELLKEIYDGINEFKLYDRAYNDYCDYYYSSSSESSQELDFDSEY
jgi:hypothetical protein